MDVIIGNIEEYWNESVFQFSFEKNGEAGSRTGCRCYIKEGGRGHGKRNHPRRNIPF